MTLMQLAVPCVTKGGTTRLNFSNVPAFLPKHNSESNSFKKSPLPPITPLLSYLEYSNPFSQTTALLSLPTNINLPWPPKQL